MICINVGAPRQRYKLRAQKNPTSYKKRDISMIYRDAGHLVNTALNTPSNKTFKHYMNEEHTHLFCFETIDDEIISKTIDSIQSKTSWGFVGISSQLLKSLKPAVMQSLRLITNQILTTGIFPDKPKMAKVVTIYKKGGNTQLCNYRPICLLPAISKVI